MSKIICGHCGTANDADNKFCISCGAPLAEKETFGNGHFGDAFSRNSRSYDRGEEIIEEFQKEVAADGNYILNGSFDQGEDRLGYWEVAADDEANVSVTNVLTEEGRVR